MKSGQAVYRSYRMRWVCGGLASLRLLGCGAVGLAVDELPKDPPSGRALDDPVRRTADTGSSLEAQTYLEVYPATPGTILEGNTTQ